MKKKFVLFTLIFSITAYSAGIEKVATVNIPSLLKSFERLSKMMNKDTPNSGSVITIGALAISFNSKLRYFDFTSNLLFDFFLDNQEFSAQGVLHKTPRINKIPSEIKYKKRKYKTLLKDDKVYLNWNIKDISKIEYLQSLEQTNLITVKKENDISISFYDINKASLGNMELINPKFLPVLLQLKDLQIVISTFENKIQLEFAVSAKANTQIADVINQNVVTKENILTIFATVKRDIKDPVSKEILEYAISKVLIKKEGENKLYITTEISAKLANICIQQMIEKYINK